MGHTNASNGANNGGNIQTHTYTDANGNTTQVQVETVVHQIDLDLNAAGGVNQGQGINSTIGNMDINQLLGSGALGNLGGNQ